jgi:hypothetical protein
VTPPPPPQTATRRPLQGHLGPALGGQLERLQAR